MHDPFQPYFPLILRRDKQIMEGHQLFLLYRFPDRTLTQIWQLLRDVTQQSQMPSTLSLPPATLDFYMNLLRKDITSLVNLLVLCLTQSVMENVQHLLKFVQHLINNLSCRSQETAVYSCGDRVLLVF